MKTYKEFNEAAALAIPAAMKIAPYVIPALGGIVKGVSAITNRETGLSDSEKRRVKELMDRVKAEKERRKVQQPEKDILDYGRQRGIAERPKKGVDEQLVVPRGLKKKDPFMTLEKEKQILRDFSNRPSVFNRATTGGRIPGVSEGYKGQRKEDALNARYKELQDPKKPEDPLKAIRLKKA